MKTDSNEALLFDRLVKIKSVNDLYNLEENAYISFSGGKDSIVLSAIVDEALPGNNIPRVYINTGIEYADVVKFVLELQKKDKRITVINPESNIRQILETYGYPFKSKEHSVILATYQHAGMTDTVRKYLSKPRYGCPDMLQYQFTSEFTLKVSDKCCDKLKKEPAERWSSRHNRTITITGIRKAEQGLRATMNACTVFTKGGALSKFHPLFPVSDDFVDWYIQYRKLELCRLYYPPFMFKRTGCKGCPFSVKLYQQLRAMETFLPEEYKQCTIIWRPVYDEYSRIQFRIGKYGHKY